MSSSFSSGFRAAVNVRYEVETMRLTALTEFQAAKRALDSSISELTKCCVKTARALDQLPDSFVSSVEGRAAAVVRALAYVHGLKTCDYYKGSSHPFARRAHMQGLLSLVRGSGKLAGRPSFASSPPTPGQARLRVLKKAIADTSKRFTLTETHMSKTGKNAEAYIRVFKWQLQTEKRIWRSVQACDVASILACVRTSNLTDTVEIASDDDWVTKIPGVMLKTLHAQGAAFPPATLERVAGGACSLCKTAGHSALYRSKKKADGRGCCPACYIAMHAHADMGAVLQGAASAGDGDGAKVVPTPNMVVMHVEAAVVETAAAEGGGGTEEPEWVEL